MKEGHQGFFRDRGEIPENNEVVSLGHDGFFILKKSILWFTVFTSADKIGGGV